MLTLASALLWLAALFTRDPPTLDAVPSRCVYITGVTWLPDCLTQAARQSENSSVRLIADSLRASYGNVVPLPSDGALAVYATKLLPNQRLPFPLQATGVGETELREEYEDGLEYNKSADGRRAIEEKRVLLLGSTARGYATRPA